MGNFAICQVKGEGRDRKKKMAIYLTNKMNGTVMKGKGKELMISCWRS